MVKVIIYDELDFATFLELTVEQYNLLNWLEENRLLNEEVHFRKIDSNFQKV